MKPSKKLVMISSPSGTSVTRITDRIVARFSSKYEYSAKYGTSVIRCDPAAAAFSVFVRPREGWRGLMEEEATLRFVIIWVEMNWKMSYDR